MKSGKGLSGRWGTFLQDSVGGNGEIESQFLAYKKRVYVVSVSLLCDLSLSLVVCLKEKVLLL